MERKNRKFEDTEAYLALQSEIELPKNVVFSYKNVDAFLRKELGLNEVACQEDNEGHISTFVNKQDNTEEGYPPYNDTLYIEALNVDDDGIDGYDFLIKDYCQECKGMYGVIYVDDWNRCYLRLGPVTSKYQILESVEYYSHMHQNYHGKLQIGLDWDIMDPDNWVWHVNERTDAEMVERYNEACNIFEERKKK